MPNPQFTIEVKPAHLTANDSFMELARMKGGYLFDEVYIRSIQHHVLGVEIVFDYERHGNRMRDLTPSTVSPNDWAVSRQKADVPGSRDAKRAAFAQTPLAERLFADGARQYNERFQKAEQDFLADTNFLGAIGPEQV